MAQNCTVLSCSSVCYSLCGHIPKDIHYTSIETGRSIDHCPAFGVLGAENLGNGEPVFAGENNGVLEFNTLTEGDNIILTENNGEITIDSTAEVNDGDNLGGGSEVFAQKTGFDLEFRTLTEGTNVTLTQTATEIEIAASGGEANTASNLGAGEGLATPKVGVDLPFKSLTAGNNVTLTPTANDITIACTGGGQTPITATDPAPTSVTGGGGFSGAAFVGNSTNSAGTITATGPAVVSVASTLTVVFSVAYAATPTVVMSAANINAGTRGATNLPWVDTISTTGFTINSDPGVGGSVPYIFNYVVIGLLP